MGKSTKKKGTGPSLSIRDIPELNQVLKIVFDRITDQPLATINWDDVLNEYQRSKRIWKEKAPDATSKQMMDAFCKFIKGDCNNHELVEKKFREVFAMQLSVLELTYHMHFKGAWDGEGRDWTRVGLRYKEITGETLDSSKIRQKFQRFLSEKDYDKYEDVKFIFRRYFPGEYEKLTVKKKMNITEHDEAEKGPNESRDLIFGEKCFVLLNQDQDDSSLGLSSAAKELIEMHGGKVCELADPLAENTIVVNFGNLNEMSKKILRKGRPVYNPSLIFLSVNKSLCDIHSSAYVEYYPELLQAVEKAEVGTLSRLNVDPPCNGSPFHSRDCLLLSAALTKSTTREKETQVCSGDIVLKQSSEAGTNPDPQFKYVLREFVYTAYDDQDKVNVGVGDEAAVSTKLQDLFHQKWELESITEAKTKKITELQKRIEEVKGCVKDAEHIELAYEGLHCKPWKGQAAEYVAKQCRGIMLFVAAEKVFLSTAEDEIDVDEFYKEIYELDKNEDNVWKKNMHDFQVAFFKKWNTIPEEIQQFYDQRFCQWMKSGGIA